jgi:hypothetical protein
MQTHLIAAFCALVTLTGSDAYSYDAVPVTQTEFPLILSQPEDQFVPFGSNTTFAVSAENADGYQWLRNGNPMGNQTNDNLVISNAGIQDVGYYSCDVFKGRQSVPTRAASLMVFTNSIDPQTGVDPIVVFSLPLISSGSQGGCPGHYTGYVGYYPGTNGWGWAPDTTNGNTVFTATDTNRPNTKVEYVGEYGDEGCNQTTVTIPNPPTSPEYEFCIYFTNNVPTNAYSITLSGFYP